jgi:hypothetical protein
MDVHLQVTWKQDRQGKVWEVIVSQTVDGELSCHNLFCCEVAAASRIILIQNRILQTQPGSLMSCEAQYSKDALAPRR